MDEESYIVVGKLFASNSPDYFRHREVRGADIFSSVYETALRYALVLRETSPEPVAIYSVVVKSTETIG